MNSKFMLALLVSPFIVSCGQKPEQDSSILSTASASAPGRFAIVNNCKGEMNSQFLRVDKNTPVLGELNISVLTKPGEKLITRVSLRQLTPAHRILGSSEISQSGLTEIKSAAIESINVSMARGSTVTLMKAAPNQMISFTTGEQTKSYQLVSLEFRNGDGADFVHLKLTLLDSATALKLNGSFSFEGCGLENISLLKANAK
jgi:hypothetical protein